MSNAIDGSEAIGKILTYRPSFLDGVRPLNPHIHAGDGMLALDEVGLRYYFECGRSALDLIDISLSYMNRPRNKVRSVLDFACGFGRVTRWLQAAFPESELVGCDVDSRAVQAVTENFGISAQSIKQDWSDVVQQRFDLIWVGSLFTHLAEHKSRQLTKILYSRLQPGGLLTFTTHGKYVVERIRSGEKTYGAVNQGSQVVAEFDRQGYGFSPYSYADDYGISAVSLECMDRVLTEADLTVLTYVERGWVKHQDFFSCRRNQD